MVSTDHIQVWNECLRIIKNNVKPAIYDAWFATTKAVSLKDDVLTIEVPSDAHMRQLEDSLFDILRATLIRVIGEKAQLNYLVKIVPGFNVNYSHQNSLVPDNPAVQFPPDENDLMNPFVLPGLRKLKIDTQLNPKYTFDNFVEGICNRLARTAGENVSKAPGNNPFNPLFIYGGSGLGKTHLAQAIGMKIKEDYPDKVVLYVSARTFKSQYVDASFYKDKNTHKNRITDFLHFYQMIDVLIVDDIQELAGSDGTQNAFFHVFNYLHTSGHQLILTSDCAPSSLQGLESRLLSRFKWGLSAELLMPDYETRLKIFKAKSAQEGITLSPEILEYLASNVRGNVRELEGTLISLLAHSTLNKEDITIDLARRVTERIVNNHTNELTFDKIRDTVCDYFKISQDQIVSKTRKREIVQARQIAMYLVRNLTQASLASIGSQMGGKDHATVLHACSTVQDLMETDKSVKHYVQELEKSLKLHN